MDKKTLKKYKPNKDRLIRIENQIQELCERESTVVMGKVTGSSADFPYTEVRTSVQMYDPYEEENVRRQIRRKEADNRIFFITLIIFHLTVNRDNRLY